MKKLLLILLLLATSPGIAEEKKDKNVGYRIVHPDGTVEFTDDASRGGEEINLHSVQTVEDLSKGQRAANPSQTRTTAKKSVYGYTGLTITSPQQEQTIQFDAKGISVDVSVDPGLRPGDMLAVYLDGEIRARGKGASLNLGEVYRGSHTISADVVDEAGNTLISSDPVTFFVRQHSVLHNNNAPKP